jgi:hypothetical protein
MAGLQVVQHARPGTRRRYRSSVWYATTRAHSLRQAVTSHINVVGLKTMISNRPRDRYADPMKQVDNSADGLPGPAFRMNVRVRFAQREISPRRSTNPLTMVRFVAGLCLARAESPELRVEGDGEKVQQIRRAVWSPEYTPHLLGIGEGESVRTRSFRSFLPCELSRESQTPPGAAACAAFLNDRSTACNLAGSKARLAMERNHRMRTPFMTAPMLKCVQ